MTTTYTGTLTAPADTVNSYPGVAASTTSNTISAITTTSSGRAHSLDCTNSLASGGIAINASSTAGSAVYASSGVGTTGQGTITATNTAGPAVYASSPVTASGVGTITTTNTSSGDALYASGSTGNGVHAVSAGSAASGVYAVATNGGVGVAAVSNTTVANYGAVQAQNTANGNAIYATSSTSSGTNGTIVAQNTTTTGGAAAAIYATSTGPGYVINAVVTGTLTGSSIAVNASNQYGYAAIVGSATAGNGVLGFSSNSYGIYGSSGSSYAGYFAGLTGVSGGDLDVINGSINHSGTGSKNFKIDHPLDPSNKFLLHACVESPDMKNIYDGTATADDAGEIVVSMPSYFEALNKDFRYQLTPIGGAATSLHIKKELYEGKFVIAGAKPGLKVSWQVTGVRKDPCALATNFEAEKEKSPDEKGLYLSPEVYGKPASEGIHWKHRPKLREAAT